MEVITNIAPDFLQIFNYAFLFVTKYYGWVFFVWGLAYMMWVEYLEEIQGQFVGSIEWTFLKILVPKENKVSTLAVESIFSQMHALHKSLTFNEMYMEGRVQQWYSLEIVSLGGNVSFLLRVPTKARSLVESAFYSQYPTAVIQEVEDYMQNFNINPFDDKDPYDIFGTEFKMVSDSVLPIKTYKDFEHPSAEETIIDPLGNLIESMERLQPHEVIALQYLIKPIQNNEFEGRAIRKIKELTGEEMPHETSFMHILMAPFEWFAKFSYKEAMLGGGHGHHEEPVNKPRNNWMSMSEGEKTRVALIENKLNKPCYNTKIRLIYIAPKANFDNNRRSEIIGAIRQFSPGGGAGIHNTIKIDKRVWTKVDPLFSKSLEKPYLDSTTKNRKLWFIKGFKKRSTHIGSAAFLLGVEEIATLFHFPITAEGAFAPAQVQAIASKTSRPPADLPIGEMN